MTIQPPFLGAHNQYSQDKDPIWNPKEIHICLLEIVCSSRYKGDYANTYIPSF